MYLAVEKPKGAYMCPRYWVSGTAHSSMTRRSIWVPFLLSTSWRTILFFHSFEKISEIKFSASRISIPRTTGTSAGTASNVTKTDGTLEGVPRGISTRPQDLKAAFANRNCLWDFFKRRRWRPNVEASLLSSISPMTEDGAAVSTQSHCLFKYEFFIYNPSQHLQRECLWHHFSQDCFVLRNGSAVFRMTDVTATNTERRMSSPYSKCLSQRRGSHFAERIARASWLMTTASSIFSRYEEVL